MTRPPREATGPRRPRPVGTPVGTAVSSRRAELVALLTAGPQDTPLVARVCEVSARVLEVTGAGMCLIGGRQHQIIVHGTDALAEHLADMQVDLGEGPCSEAVRTGRPVVVPDLAADIPSGWSRYASEALDRGVRALFTFPLQVGDLQLGALDLYRLTPGALTPDQMTDAHLLTGIANRSMLAQKDRIHVDGSVSVLHWLSAQDREDRPGRGTAVDLGITVGDALAPGRLDADSALRDDDLYRTGEDGRAVARG